MSPIALPENACVFKPSDPVSAFRLVSSFKHISVCSIPACRHLSLQLLFQALQMFYVSC